MASQGRGLRGRPRGTPPVFDQQAFVEAIGAAAVAIAQAGAIGEHGGPNNLQRFIAHHPPAFREGGDPMVADHWFRQVERVLEAMEITSNVTKIRLATFQLEGESQVWWDWVKASRNLEAMMWEEFRELFMCKFFPASAKYAKAREFLELKQGTMTVLEYVAKFTELARFGDDYVASDMAKVRKLEDGLKLSIRGKIAGLLLQDMDSMVRTALAIEREIDDARSIRDTGAGDKRKEGQPSSSSGKRQKTSASHKFQDQGREWAPSQARQVMCYLCRQHGHVRQDCPQRQGSQNVGTAQSQLDVEQESIQFIPPHPSAGQRNQFQFQGAIQAPSAAQVGQRGQSVGRGQVHDSQAGTSSQVGPTICYFCRQPGHMRRDCPRRQRPHGTEIERSD